MICSDLQHINIKTHYILLNNDFNFLDKEIFPTYQNSLHRHFGQGFEEIKTLTKYKGATIYLLQTIGVSKQHVNQLP